jgi:hypothetical protein
VNDSVAVQPTTTAAKPEMETVMAIHKLPVVKRPIKIQNNGSPKIIYRVIRDIQHIKNSSQLGTATIQGKSCMVRSQGNYWVVV